MKSGKKRWQIFLYSKSRFQTDDAFQSMNGVGQLLIKCLDIYPNTFDEYIKNKKKYKEFLRKPMKELCEKFNEKGILRTFLNKSIFNGGEVNYWTIKHNNKFHVFFNKDVIDTFSQFFQISNSIYRKPGDTPEQKVLFKYKGKNLGELEVRNSDKKNHYREILFVMNKQKVLDLLFEKIKFSNHFNDKVLLYVKANKKFKKEGMK